VEVKQLFVSYSRADMAAVDELVRRFSSLDYQGWVDSSLRGGQSWPPALHAKTVLDTPLADAVAGSVNHLCFGLDAGLGRISRLGRIKLAY
jgi:hypothetical protein